MDIFEFHTYDRMPVPPPARPAEPVFENLFKRRAPPVREPFSVVSFWRSWVDDRG